MERMMTAKEVSEYTQIPLQMIYQKTRNGELPCYRLGRLVRFKAKEIDEAMKGGKNANKSETECRSNSAFK